MHRWFVLFSSASASKIFACSARHDTCAKLAVPRHEHPRTRPSFVFSGGPACRTRLALRVVRARCRRDRDGLRYFLFALYCSRRLLLLAERVVAAPFSAAPGTRRRSSVCCSGRIAQGQPSSWRRRRTALGSSCMWSTRSGQPYGAKCLHKDSSFKASALQPLAAAPPSKLVGKIAPLHRFRALHRVIFAIGH